eukprot:4862263-Pyramimonas_sp.AAC.1
MATTGRVGCAAPPGAEAACAAPLNASFLQPRDMSVGGCVAGPPDLSRNGCGGSGPAIEASSASAAHCFCCAFPLLC